MLIKGIFTDVEVNNQPPEFARHLKNVLLTEQLGTPVNEPGFQVCVPGSSLPYEVNGVYVIDEAIVLYSAAKEGNASEIGIVENCSYRRILNDGDFTEGKLNFSIQFPIDTQHYINFNGERIIAWIDDINEPRILNIDRFQVQELNDIRIFPFAATPDLILTVRDSGGALESGTHQVVVSYANTNGLETNWFALGRPLSITDDPLGVTYGEYDGVAAGTITSKSIEINVTNADTRFELLRIGVVKTIDSIVTAQFIKEVPIGSANFTTIYTGIEGTITDLTLNEILVPSASYKAAKAIGQVNNKLYLANLTVEEEIDLTEVALATNLQWSASFVAQTANTLTDDTGSSKNPNNHISFWPGEVYAFYLVGEKLDGTDTKGFHIPGREQIPEDILVNSAGAVGKLTDDPLNWEVDAVVPNVASVVPGVVVKGDFGYWENKNEPYPGTTFSTETESLPGSIIQVQTGIDNIIKITESTSSFFGTASSNGLVQDIINDTAAGVERIILESTSGSLVIPYYTIYSSNAGAGTIDLNLGDTNLSGGDTPGGNLVNYIWRGVGGNSDDQPSVNWQGPITSKSQVVTYGQGLEVNTTSLPFPAENEPSVLPVAGDVVELAGFTTGNGFYQVQGSAYTTGTTAKILIVGGVDHVTGTGTVNYSRTVINSAGSFPEGNVRHHRFPTLNKLRTLSSNPATIGKTIFPKLSVLAENVNIPAALQEKITKWKIVYAKRTPANATIVGQAMYQYAGCQDADYRVNAGSAAAGDTTLGKKFSSHTGNFVNGNTRNDNPGQGEQSGRFFANQFPHQEIIKFNSFDLIFGKPTVGSLYLRQEVRFSEDDAFTPQYDPGTGLTIGSLTGDSGVYQNPKVDDADNARPKARWLFLNHEAQYTGSATRDGDLLREVTSYTYLPSNVIDLSALGVGGDTRTGEESLYLKVKGGQPVSTIADYKVSADPDSIPALDLSVSFIISADPTQHPGGPFLEETFLSSLCQRKSDIYSPFTEQPLVIADTTTVPRSSETSGGFFGGDCRINFTGLKQLMPYAADPKFQQVYNSTTNPGEGTQGIRYHGSYSNRNVGLRHINNTETSTFYYPKINDFVGGIFAITLPGDFRTFLYNEDYSLLNEYNSLAIFNPTAIPASTLLPHTIASSVTNNLEERTISWQNFLASDRYVMPRNKGPIINLQGVSNDRLFIHQRDSLFITRSTTTLVGDITDVTLGSAELFSVTPTEVLSTDEGFAGTQHKFACKLTKLGYAFPDAAQGKIFLHNGKDLEEISKYGQRIFFRDAIDTNLLDNPFQGSGMTITFDERYNRLLFGHRSGVTSFTTSYSPATKAWASFHDYFPEYLIETRRKLYSLKNDVPTPGYKAIYEHHTGAFGIYYNVIEDFPIPFPVLIDIVYNPDPYDNKIFGAVEWATEVVNASGVQAKDETIDYITLSNNTKTTGRVELERLANLSQIHGSNFRNVNSFWTFNGLRNVAVTGIPFRLDFYDDFAIIDANLNYNKSWYDKARFIDRFMIARFEYLNGNNSKFAFLDHESSFRKSYR